MTNYRIPTIYNPEGKCLAQIQGYPCDHGSQRCEQYATNRRTHVNQTEDCNRPQCWCNRPAEPATDPKGPTVEDYRYIDCDDCQTNHADDEACSL